MSTFTQELFICPVCVETDKGSGRNKKGSLWIKSSGTLQSGWGRNFSAHMKRDKSFKALQWKTNFLTFKAFPLSGLLILLPFSLNAALHILVWDLFMAEKATTTHNGFIWWTFCESFPKMRI